MSTLSCRSVSELDLSLSPVKERVLSRAPSNKLKDILDIMDQEEASDRMDGSFLFSFLRPFGSGDGFLSWVSLLFSVYVPHLSISRLGVILWLEQMMNE